MINDHVSWEKSRNSRIQIPEGGRMTAKVLILHVKSWPNARSVQKLPMSGRQQTQAVPHHIRHQMPKYNKGG
jgi:hypothetical protein